MVHRFTTETSNLALRLLLITKRPEGVGSTRVSVWAHGWRAGHDGKNAVATSALLNEFGSILNQPEHLTLDLPHRASLCCYYIPLPLGVPKLLTTSKGVSRNVSRSSAPTDPSFLWPPQFGGSCWWLGVLRHGCSLCSFMCFSKHLSWLLKLLVFLFLAH